MKSQPTRKSQEVLGLKFYHFIKPIMRNLYRVVVSGATDLDLLFGGFTTSPHPQYQRRKIDLCGYHNSNYFARLVSEMRLFSKVCNRS